MSLLLWLPLIENSLQDRCGNTITTSKTLPTYDTSGKLGGSYSFSSHNIKVSNLYASGSMTFALWICFSTVTSCHILDFRHSSGEKGYQPIYYNTSSGVQLFSSTSPSGDYIATGALTAGTWYHIAVVIGDGYGKLYLNGEYKGQVDLGVPNCATELFLGSRCSGSNLFQGKMNDVRIYDHALSVKEVRDLSKALVMHYDFEDASINANLYNTASSISSNSKNRCSVVAYGTNGFTMTSTGSDPYLGTSTTSGGSVGSNYKNTIPSGTTQICLSWTHVSGPELNKSYMTFLNSSGGAINTSHNNFGNQIVSVGARRYVIQELPSGTTSVHVRFGNQTLASGSSITIDQISLKVGNVYDFSQYGLQGSPYNNTGLYQATTITNVAASQSAGKGRLSGAFNGSVLRCPFSTEGWTEFTMAAWVNPSARHSERSCVIIGGMYLTVDSNGKISVYCYGKSPAGYHAGNGVVPLNTWTHIAAVWSSANVKLFINGVLDKTIATTGTASSSSHAKKDIGAENGNTSRVFQGLMDDVRVYGTALSDEDIRELALTRWAANKPGQVFSGLINEGESKHHISKTGVVNCNTLNEAYSIPDDYARITYVGSTGSSYIDTGVAPGTNLSFEIIVSHVSSNAYILTQGNYGLRAPGYFTNFVSGRRFKVTSIGISGDPIFYIKGSNDGLQVNNFVGVQESDNDTPSGNVKIMASGSGRIYDCKIWDGDQLVRCFVPAARLNDNIIGLYDLVSKQFFVSETSTECTGDILRPETVVGFNHYGHLHCNEFNEI